MTSINLFCKSSTSPNFCSTLLRRTPQLFFSALLGKTMQFRYSYEKALAPSHVCRCQLVTSSVNFAFVGLQRVTYRLYWPGSRTLRSVPIP